MSSTILILMVCSMLLLAPSAVVGGPRQEEPSHVGEIEFFGYGGLDLGAVRAALPVHEGDALAPGEIGDIHRRLKAAVKRVTGHDPTDVSLVCCDAHGDTMIYIGLTGSSSRPFSFNAAQQGKKHFPPGVLGLYAQWEDALSAAVRRGASGEDDSRGYSLSVDPLLRAKQLAMRDYAIHHEALICRVLSSSSDARQRQVAAELLGYTSPSKSQIDTLVHASRDPDEVVRNNAVRALAVLAESNPVRARQIPAATSLAMLNSGEWSDRNKGSWLLLLLTQSRDSRLLAEVRTRCLDFLIEMARWRHTPHARAGRILLGRIAGIPETRAEQMAESGEVEEIIRAEKDLHSTGREEHSHAKTHRR